MQDYIDIKKKKRKEIESMHEICKETKHGV